MNYFICSSFSTTKCNQNKSYSINKSWLMFNVDRNVCTKVDFDGLVLYATGINDC